MNELLAQFSAIYVSVINAACLNGDFSFVLNAYRAIILSNAVFNNTKIVFVIDKNSFDCIYCGIVKCSIYGRSSWKSSIKAAFASAS